jgi:indole-3-glycerol phosphate synthase/phosphoribosylanthranilate isomerase
MDILEKIVAARKERIKQGGAAQGLLLPDKREVPVVPFGCNNSGGRGRRFFVIGEVKGKSPSAGIIKNSLDPVSTAEGYAAAGLKEISVLTEEEFFGGSLRFLYEVKKKLPFCSLLRKDFLFSEEDIEVSYLAGADAVLLIASILRRNFWEILSAKRCLSE